MQLSAGTLLQGGKYKIEKGITIDGLNDYYIGRSIRGVKRKRI